MRSKTLLFTTLALLAFAMVGSVEARSQHAYSVRPGGVVYVDTLDWSNGQGVGASGMVDTLIGATGRDTSEVFSLANLQFLGATFVHTNSQGTAGGTHSYICSLEVSIDGSNWFRPAAGPVFSTSSSADPWRGTPIVYYSDTRDSVATEALLAAGDFRYIVGSARLGRFVSKQVSGAADTTFGTVVVYKEYRP